MSYVFDVYYKKAKVQRNVLNVGLYITLFPQLIAGPIVRYETVADEIEDRHDTINDDGFAHRFLGSDPWAAVEPFIPFIRQEAEAFCLDLYTIFSSGLEPFADHPDTDYFAFYGLNAFFVVGAAITLKALGYQGTSPDESACPNQDTVPAAAQVVPQGSSEANLLETPNVQRSTMTRAIMGKPTQPDSPENFWVVLLYQFILAAKQRGYIDDDIPMVRELIQPGVEFAYALMKSKPYYDSNKDDVKRYHFKMARHCFYAGAYYTWLWKKKSKGYLKEDFHLRTLRANLPATIAPLLPFSLDEASQFCLDLYITYMDEIAPYTEHPEYPVFMANGMHAFYMTGIAVQLVGMRVG